MRKSTVSGMFDCTLKVCWLGYEYMFYFATYIYLLFVSKYIGLILFLTKTNISKQVDCFLPDDNCGIQQLFVKHS